MAKSDAMMRSVYRKFHVGAWGADWALYRYAVRYLSGRRLRRVKDSQP